MLIQIDLPKELHKQLNHYKIDKEHTTLEDSVVEILMNTLMKKKGIKN